MTEPTCRPRERLLALGREHPGAWSVAAEMRAGRGVGFPDWPDWCYLPMGGWDAILRESGRLTPQALVALSALGAWRMTQGVYRFDPTLYEALVSTPLAGDLPCESLYRLPEWCVYLETPGLLLPGLTEGSGLPVEGAWAHLEHDANTGRPELRFALDVGDGRDLVPLALHLGAWPLQEAVERMLGEAQRQGLAAGLQAPPLGGAAGVIRSVTQPLLSLLLYLCVDEPDLGGERRPTNPVPVKTRRRGPKLIPASSPTTWDVGVRLGAAIRAAQGRERGPGDGTHASPRPHVRRAHWATYWTGPKSAPQVPVVKWLPPIPVGAGDELPAVIRPVR